MKDKVELDATYPHAPETVWQALTDPAALAQWLLPADFKPLIGFRFRLDRPSGDAIKGKVIEVEEGRLLAYTWDDGESPEPSVVCWTLEPTDDGTHVRLEHRYVETPEVNCIPMVAYFNWRYALRYRLPGLLALLAGGQSRPPVFYRDVLGAVAGHIAITPLRQNGTQRENEPQAEAQGVDRIGFRQEVMA